MDLNRILNLLKQTKNLGTQESNKETVSQFTINITQAIQYEKNRQRNARSKSYIYIQKIKETKLETGETNR